jgi:hypothetical protein
MIMMITVIILHTLHFSISVEHLIGMSYMSAIHIFEPRMMMMMMMVVVVVVVLIL